MESCVLSRVWLFAVLWSGAHQTPLSTGYSRQGYWSGLPFLSPAVFLTSFNVEKILPPSLMCDWLLLSGPHHESESRSVVSDSLPPHGLYSPWDSPGQNTGVGSLSLLQGIFPTQGSNPGLPHCRQILYQLSHKGSPTILKWVAYPFSSESSWPKNQIRVSCITGGFFPNWAIREAWAPP